MKFLVKKNNWNMLGVFTQSAYSKGKIIAELEGDISDVQDKYSIQIGDNMHMHITNELKYLNHSCTPNAFINNGLLMAKGLIKEGDELFFDYNSTEEIITSPFHCNCCGKLIKGKKYVLSVID